MAVVGQNFDAGSHFGAVDPRRAPPPAPLEEMRDEEAGRPDLETPPVLSRQISATPVMDYRLVGCSVPSPTCGDAPEAPRLEFPDFRRKAMELAEEFLCERECRGTVDSIVALGCPSYHDELVAMLLRLSMDRHEAEREAVVALLNALANEGHLTGPQLARGFEKLVLGWDDLQLDVPDAAGQIAALLSSKVGLLDRGLFVRLPEGLLRRLRAGLQEPQARAALDQHLEDLVAFKAGLRGRLEADLFAAHSVENIAAWLRSQDKPIFHHEVVLASCLESLSKDPEQTQERQRWALLLLAHLSSEEGGGLLSDVDMQMGFSRLLGALGQTGGEEGCRKLEQDQAVGLFRSAVEHELLPAEFLKSARRMRFGGPPGVQVLRAAQRQTPMHSRRIWGSGDERHFQTEIREAILEYFDSYSAQELGRIVEELHLSETEQARFMRKLMVTGMERGEAEPALDAISALLGRCWTLEEVRLAFEQLRDVSADLVLDFPKCRESTSDLVVAAVGRGLLEKADLDWDGATIV